MSALKKLLPLALAPLIAVASSCQIFLPPVEESFVDITSQDYIEIYVGDSLDLSYSISPDLKDSKQTWSVNDDCINVQNGKVTAVDDGVVAVTLSVNGISDTIIIKVKPSTLELKLSSISNTVKVGESIPFTCNLFKNDNACEMTGEIVYSVTVGQSCISVKDNFITGVSEGTAQLIATYGEVKSNTLSITVSSEGVNSDPYEGMTNDEFYSNYTIATSYQDSVYRTKHGFMSGSIEAQDQAPTLAQYMPKDNGKYIRNTSAYYSPDGNTYYIVDCNGDVVNAVYRGGAYVTLEEVAAYVFAFGEIPANHSTKKSGSPSSSIWGKYLRLNHSKFSGDTSRYPYEPELPDISGCGGDLTYYEMDVGTTGNDCDPSYTPRVYNNGSSITRGASRIVYSRYDRDGDAIIDINEKYLFYTYNHYNDFQEYLNYQGGWGEKFGNITGGGSISSKTDYNPTPYVEVIRKNFLSL